jgi:hypothetical protein
MEPNGNGSKIFTVKNWHVVLTLIVWAATMLTGWVTVRAQTEQNQKDIEILKQNTVSKERYDEMREDILRRLQRIEDKLDRDKMMRDVR